MTNEEAIKKLDEFGGCCSLDLEYIAAHKAIEALEKQIKRKVEFVSKKGFQPPKCPVCHYILYNDTYCPHCGQALDWGDEE